MQIADSLEMAAVDSPKFTPLDPTYARCSDGMIVYHMCSSTGPFRMPHGDTVHDNTSIEYSCLHAQQDHQPSG